MHTHTLTIEIQLRTEELCLKTQGIAQTYRGALEAVGAGLPDQTRPRGGKLILVWPICVVDNLRIYHDVFYSLKVLQFPFKRILYFTYFDQISQPFQIYWFLLLTFPVNWSPLSLCCFRWIPILLSICLLLVWFSLKLPKVVLQHIPIKTPPNPQQFHCNPIAPHWCWQVFSAPGPHNLRSFLAAIPTLNYYLIARMISFFVTFATKVPYLTFCDKMRQFLI